MRTLFLTSVCFLSALLCHSRGKEPVFYIDSTISIKAPMPFASSRVLTDGVFDPASAYYVINKKELTHASPHLNTQIEAFLNLSANRNHAASRKVTIVLHKFGVRDVDFAGGIISLRLHADYYIGESNSLTHLYTIDTLYEKRRRSFKENYAGKFAAACLLESSFEAFRHINEVRGATRITEEVAVKSYEELVKHFALYTSQDAPPAGIYRSREEYLNRTPGSTEVIFEHIPQLEGEGLNNFYTRSADGRKKDRISPGECFAASDGKTFYISYADKWHRAKKIDNEYYIVILRGAMHPVTTGFYSSLTGLAAGGLEEEFSPQNDGEREQAHFKARYSLQKGEWIPVERSGLLLK